MSAQSRAKSREPRTLESPYVSNRVVDLVGSMHGMREIQSALWHMHSMKTALSARGGLIRRAIMVFRGSEQPHVFEPRSAPSKGASR